MSCERALNFDQWKTFSENYKPIRVWLWLVYKFTENYCSLQLFPEFIQAQKRYPTSLDKIRILAWKLLVISSQNFSCELNSLWELTPSKISHICCCGFKLHKTRFHFFLYFFLRLSCNHSPHEIMFLRHNSYFLLCHPF